MKPFYFLITFSILFSFHSIECQAQKKTKSSTPTKKETPKSEVIDVFGNPEVSEPTSSKKKSTPVTEQKNMIKLDLVQSILGNVILSYERVLTERFGVEVGVGLSRPNIDLVKIIEDLDDHTQYGSSVFGPYFGADIKYYTDSYDSPEGIYVALGGAYSKFGREPIKSNGVVWTSGSTQKDVTRLDLIRVKFGSTNIWDRFVSDWYVGLGLRQTQETNYLYKANGTYDVSTPDKKNNIFFTVGYKLGIYF
jgi:hypothetical protein